MIGNTVSDIDDSGSAPDDEVAVFLEANPSFSDAHVNDNNLTVDSDQFGIAVHPSLTGSPLDGECNWWGAASGPSGAGSGTGSMVGPNVDFIPWRTAPAPGGPCTGFPPITHAASRSFTVFGTSDSRSVNVPNVPNRILVFVFAGKLGSDTLTSVTYGGTPLTTLASRNQASVHLEVRYLVNPPAGAHALAWTKSGASQNITWGFSVYSGREPDDPVRHSLRRPERRATPSARRASSSTPPPAISSWARSCSTVRRRRPQARWRARGQSAALVGGTVAHAGRLLGQAGVGLAGDDGVDAGPGSGSNALDWAQIGAPLQPVGTLRAARSTRRRRPSRATTASNVAPGTAVTDTATVGPGRVRLRRGR